MNFKIFTICFIFFVFNTLNTYSECFPCEESATITANVNNFNIGYKMDSCYVTDYSIVPDSSVKVMIKIETLTTNTPVVTGQEQAQFKQAIHSLVQNIINNNGATNFFIFLPKCWKLLSPTQFVPCNIEECCVLGVYQGQTTCLENFLSFTREFDRESCGSLESYLSCFNVCLLF